MGATELTTAVKALAYEAGFARVGIAPATEVSGREAYLRWLEQGCHADMAYMARNVDKRLRPELLVEGARSVICLAVSYAPGDTSAEDQDAEDAQEAHDARAKIARYARGPDYHKVLKRRCEHFMEDIAWFCRQLPRPVEFAGRAFVDSAPVMERSLAARAGLGWIGQSGLLIVPALGSYVLLAEIACNLPLEADEPIASQCGGCGACREACPTGALRADGTLDARRCISYHTVENRGDIPRELWPLMGCRLLGCDACQEACPHNRVVLSGDDELAAAADAQPTIRQVLQWAEGEWDAATRSSARRRATLEMHLRNAVIAAGNSGQKSLTPLLRKLARQRPALEPLVRWALGRLAQ